MRCSQLVAPQRSGVVDAPTPDPGRGEVLVRITACGVCASELHPWQDGVATYPTRLGHEPVGVVEATGPEVTTVAVGDRVTGLFNPAFSDHALASAEHLLPVPENLPDHAALGEPLACLVNALRRTPVELGDRVALIGLGYMGLGFLQLLKLRGPSRIVAIDVRAEAREKARDIGADEAYHPAELPDAYRLTSFADWESERGFDVVIEASGTQPGLTLAGELVRAHGVLSILGYHQGGDRQVDMQLWNWKAIDVVNAHVRRRTDLMESMRIGLALEARGAIDLGSLVTHRFGLGEVDAAFTALRDKPAGYIKALVETGR